MKTEYKLSQDHDQAALELHGLCFGHNPNPHAITIESGGIAAKCARHLAMRRGIDAEPCQVEEAAQSALVSAWTAFLEGDALETSRLTAYRAAGVALNHEFSQGKTGSRAESDSASINTVPIDYVSETALAYDTNLDPDPEDRSPGRIATIERHLDALRAKLPPCKGKVGARNKAVFALAVALANGSDITEAVKAAGYASPKSAVQACQHAGILPNIAGLRTGILNT